MKDLVISKSRQKREFLYVFLCFLLTFGANAYAIQKYKSDWMELLTQLPYVLVFTAALYAAFTLFRLFILFLIKTLTFPFKRHSQETKD